MEVSNVATSVCRKMFTVKTRRKKLDGYHNLLIINNNEAFELLKQRKKKKINATRNRHVF